MNGVILQNLANGVVTGSSYGMMALGYSLIYGSLQVLNLAHGDLLMVGGFIGWGVSALLAPVAGAWGLLAAVLAAFAGVGLCGVLLERVAYRPLMRAGRLAPLLSALGASLILQNAALLLFGARAKVYPPVGKLSALGLGLGSVRVPFSGAFLVLVAFLLMVAVDQLVARTPLGFAIRAVSQNREAAELIGIPVGRVFAATFFLGAGLAGAGGVLLGFHYGQVDFFMGFSAGLKAFTSAVIGGIGNPRGAVAGGLLLGLSESLAVTFFSPAYRDVISLLLLVAVLVAFPRGLFSSATVEKL